MRRERWFRPDVEGLRAVAVVAVLAFHAGVPGTAGGFVGVDVFFVISGFLITTLLVRELERTGTVSLAGFYARRARRILPPAALVLAATLLGAGLVLPPLTVVDVARDGLAVALQAANWHFVAAQVDYSAAGRASSPLLHYWSLAVEEQFYLAWAPLVLGTCLFTRWHRRRTLLAAIGALSLVSLVLAVRWTAGSEPLAYLGSPSRAWQFGAGAMLALSAPVLARGARRGAGAVAAWLAGWAGAAAVVASVALLGPPVPYPGVAALAPTLGTVAVIGSGLRPRTGRLGRTGVGSVLATAPFRAVGRISFGWYLWHWPVLVLGQAVLGPLAWPGRVLLVQVGVPLSWLTFRLVERPLQRAPSVALRPRDGLALGLAATVGSLVVAIGVGSPALSRMGARAVADVAGADVLSGGATSGPVTPSPAVARDDQPRFPPDCQLAPGEVRQPACRFAVRAEATGLPAALTLPPVVLFGDSHAGQWYPLAVAVAARLGRPVEVLAKSGCPVSTLSVRNPQLGRDFTECYRWRDDMLDRIRSEHPRMVIVAGYNHYEDTGTPLSAWMPMMEALERDTTQVLYVEDTPYPGTDVPACMSEHLSDWSACAFPRRTAGRPDALVAAVVTGRLRGVAVISAWGSLCPGRVCPAARGGVLLYRDDSHLTDTVARQLVPSLLADLQRHRTVPPPPTAADPAAGPAAHQWARVARPTA